MTEFRIIHKDPAFVVVIKPPGVLSTDEPGGLPDLCREALGDSNIRTVHRLDRVVSGLMVLARTKRAASDLSAEIRDGIFHKEYTAVLHGNPPADSGTLTDLLARDKAERKTYVVTEPGKDVQEAILNYEVLARTEEYSKVRIELITGRTHQIRCQFSSRNLPLVGDRKYSINEDNCDIALWSSCLRFNHPKTGEKLIFNAPPPDEFPWNQFKRGRIMANYDFFQNKACEYFPCHQNADPETFSCIFCYCPLYSLGEHCGGNFTYTNNGIKDCSQCLRPHKRECYGQITEKVGEIIKLVQKNTI